MATTTRFAAAESRDPIQAAAEALQAGNTQRAMELYREGLKQAPENLTALINLGALTYQTGNLAEALPLFEKAFDVAPNAPNTQSNLIAAHEANANIMMNNGDFPAAAEGFRRILAVDPHYSAARVNLVDCLCQGEIPARTTDFSSEADVRNRSLNVVIACMPKSGSTWLQLTLRALTGFGHGAYAFALTSRRHRDDVPRMRGPAAFPCHRPEPENHAGLLSSPRRVDPQCLRRPGQHDRLL